MSKQPYQSFYERLDIEALTADVLLGDPEQGMNACQEVCDKWAEDPERVALQYHGVERAPERWTFSELKAASARFANLLKAQGVGKGDRVAALLPRTPELMIVVLGTLRVGAVYQPLFTAFGSGAIEYRLDRASTRLIVTDDQNRFKLEGIQKCPPIVRVSSEPENIGDDIDFHQAMAAQSDQFEPVMILGEDPILQMFTSGTVGKSKGVAVPARALLSFYIYMRYAIDLQPEDRYWNVADPGWAYGLYYAVLGPLLVGATTHFNENGFTPETTYNMIREYGITNLAAAPTAYRLLMANDQVLSEGESLGLRVASSAGEALNPEVINWVNRRLGCPVMDQYGQTETGMTCCNHHALEHPVKVGSMGYSLPGHKVVALDGDYKEVGAGETGQLAVDVHESPLFFFQGYTWGEKNPFHDRYYLTGDVVISHGDGSFSFTGRDDDIISTAGYRVGPADVESALLEHPAVAESGVVGKPDSARGAIIKAYVVVKPRFDADENLADELKELVRNRLSAHAFPREIEFVTSLPKTPSGKIQRFILRNQAREEADQ
ncbi:AMP-binding protein [Marinobacterium sp. AK62]|uniref:AMP-binding protein n=1 Tax=Marinobacterium alkalitolerans TaxID=1542925 RepID=A0ABS3Z8P0_9GAMM|nr:AMP-binding protein [Marinobacterium alkalitolerans]MBP0048080.1 AMP-binding protein [Marinobacterium alkalitolerans]